MSTSGGEHDDEFIERLESLDLAIAARAHDEKAHESQDADSDGEGDERMRRARVCLDLLDRARRQASDDTERADAATETPNPEGESAGGLLSEDIQQLGRFEIVRELGHGGLSVVFLANDPKLGRQVALKVPRPEVLVERSMRRRFMREAEAAARLDHPHIVRVYEVDEDGPVCFIASEYCPGMTLAAWLAGRNAPVPAEVAARLINDLAAAVEHAHSRAVLHRDIKPSNVLVEVDPLRADRIVRVRLADFGMAKLLEQGGGDTRSGAIIGTLDYMPPEQAKGRPEEVDVRADVYSLGAILYELLTGVPRVRGVTNVDALRQVLFEEPPTPRRIRPTIPRDVEAICLKCLAPRPSDRYATAHGLIVDLQRYLRGEPTIARPAGAVERIWKWSRRRPAWATLAGASAVGLITVLAVVFAYNRELGRALASADTAREGEAIARENAESLQRAAEDQARRLRRLLYAADMRYAFEAWEHGDAAMARERLLRYAPEAGEEDLRTFAWHFLWRRCAPSGRPLIGHDGDVYALAFAPAGDRLATVGADGTVRLWAVNEARDARVLGQHSGEVNAVSWSPKGDHIATAGDDGAVRIWEADGSDAAPVTTLQVPDCDSVYAACFSSNGAVIATGGTDQVITLWNTDSWSAEAQLTGHTGDVESIAVSSDGELLASASADGTVALWDTAAGTRKLVLDGHEGRLSSVAFSHDDRLLVSCGLNDQTARVWNVGSGDEIGVLTEHANWVHSAAFSRDDSLIASACKDGVVHLWDGATYERLASLLGHDGRVWAVRFAPQSNALATAGADGKTLLWSLDEVHQRKVTQSYPRGIQSIGMSTGRSAMVLGRDDGVLHLVDEQGRSLWELNVAAGHTRRYFDVSPDGTQWAAVTAPGEISIGSMETGERLHVLGDGSQRLGCLRFSPDGAHLAAGDSSGGIHVWNSSDGSLVSRFSAGAKPVLCLDYSPTTGELAVAGELRRVAIFSPSDGRERHSLKGYPRRINALEFSPDGSALAIGGEDRVVTLWRTGDGTRSTLVGHESHVQAVCFSPDGHTLATASTDRTMRLWDLRALEEIAVFANHPGPVNAVAFTADGRTLCAGGGVAPADEADSHAAGGYAIWRSAARE